MTMTLNGEQAQGPRSFWTLAELPRSVMEMAALPWALPVLKSLPRGDGHTVMVLPGFAASDCSTSVLRAYLSNHGYHVLPWGLGRNTGKPALVDDLHERVSEAADQASTPISLVGQSLGGVFARELARRDPGQIRQVISLGSPFGWRHRSNTAAPVRHLFRALSGDTVGRARARARYADIDMKEAPNVPCTAIYSRTDGIVGWSSCLERAPQEGGGITENIEVMGSHCGMSVHPAVLYAVAQRLQFSADNWQPFRSKHQHLSWIYPKPAYPATSVGA